MFYAMFKTVIEVFYDHLKFELIYAYDRVRHMIKLEEKVECYKVRT